MSLCDHAHINFNQAALRTVLKPENISSSSQAKHTCTLCLCVCFKYASFYRRFQSFQSISVWIYFNRLQNTRAKLFRIWKTWHRAHKDDKYPYASFVCTLQVCIKGSMPFSIVSVAVWITVFARFDRCLNLFQSITKHCSTGAKLFCIWSFLFSAFFDIRESPSRSLW